MLGFGQRLGQPGRRLRGRRLEEKAIQASQKALELLPGDKSIPEPFKKLVEQNAEGKLQRLKVGAK